MLGTKKKSNKRKQRNITAVEDEVQEYPKAARIDQFQDERKVDDGSPWNNLQLVLSLQDKHIDIIKKVDLAFDYVKSSSIKDLDDITRRSQVLDTSRTIVFLNNWVQSVLISSEKKLRLEKYEAEFDSSNGSLLDLRCWKVLHFCLEESKNLHISLACSKDFLRVIHCIATDVSSYLKNMSLSCEETLSSERLQLYDVVLDCISLVFSFHGGVANENLDLWIMLLDKLLEVILKIIVSKLDGNKLGNFVLKMSCYLFEPFAKFLRLHPTRKNGFRDFIEKLLEPLLHLLYILRSGSPFCNVELRTNLSELIEEVLAQGIFHPTHIDGFLSSQSTGKYRNSSDATGKEEKLVNKSYHKHLFDKVEKIVAKKNGLAVAGLGELLHLFVTCVTKHKGASAGETSKQSNISSTSHVHNSPFQNRSVISKKNIGFPSMDAELRKYIFDYFVQTMEYLLADVNKSLQSDWELEPVFLNVPSTLKSINNLLATFINDKLYLRTEDTSDGASKNFLRVIYEMVTSFSEKISHLTKSSFGSVEKSQRVLISVKKELIVAVHHLLNIEYEVVGDDLESLWTMVFSSMAHSSMDVMGQPLLSPEILSLCCRLVDLYSELRQVHSSIFALCRAVRNSVSLLLDSKECIPSQFYSSYSNSLSMLFCSSEFRLSLSNAIKAIPEGQAAGCIQQLSSDINESLEWIGTGHQLTGQDEISKANPQSSDSLHFPLRAEILGKVLSELYTVILDSITVSSGNSYLIGVSLKSLIEILRPSLSSLVALQPDTINEIFIVVDGRTLSKSTGCDNVSMCWILVFLFHLLLSCRSLFRQAISLMSPNSSKKMSGVIGDSATIHSGKDWLEMAGFDDKGFFSWIIHPSAPLLNVIHFVSEINTQDSIVVCSPLVYVLNAMALQRLVDLNRLIKSSEYMLQWNQSRSETNSKDDDEFSIYNKRIKKWKKNVLGMRKEAAGLIKFMMQFLLSMPKDQISEKIDDTLIQGQHNNVTGFAVGSLDETSLPSTLWWVICQNIDIWCSHAAKKDLKNFLRLLIQSSLPCLSNDNGHFRMRYISKHCLKKVTEHQIALKFLSNTLSYEQKFVRRYMASMFCKILQMSVQSIFSSSEIDLSISPDWIEVISEVENLSNVTTETRKKPNKVLAESCSKQPSDEFANCHWLLNLWMRMPEEYLSLRSSSLYITYILNLERLLVESLLGQQSASCSHDSYQIFQLFVSCRRVLKILTVSSCHGTLNGHLSLPWLLKSIYAVIGFQHAFPQDIAFEAKVPVFSLMDDTSNALLTVSSNQFERAISSFDSAKKLHGERKSVDPSTEESDQSECDIQLNHEENLNAWQSICQLSEMLDEHLDQIVECSAKSQELNKLSSIVCCGQGLLCGIASALGNKNTSNKNFRIKLSSNNAELITKVNSWVDSWVNFLIFSLKAFFLEDNPALDTSACGSNALKDGEMGPAGKMEPSDTKGNIVNCNLKKKSHPPIPDLEAFLTEVQNGKRCLKKSLLLEILRGENAEAGFFLQQVFIACSAILRLNLLMDLKSISWSLFLIVIDISQFLLLEFSRSEILHQISLTWLDGAVKFLEELGSYFPKFDPMLSRDFYVNLIGLHLRVIGKCISFQGKEAKLASQETGSHAKRLDEFKARLKVSLRTYVKKSSEYHLLSAIQAVERALVGVQEGLTTSYEIVCGGSDGGEASANVAAGIDCLDMILEFVTGHRRLSMINRHIQGFVASLLNIILHLHSPSIFYANVDSTKAYASPDSGSVILMCIEVLNKIFGKSSYFQIDACHIASSLRAPGALFQYFLQLQISENPVKAFSGISKSRCAIDRKFAVELYAASCRLLCTALKHHKSETWQCIALLEDSISTLLNCLETVKTDESFAWEVQQAVKCASSLRRVYEEVRQQKDVFAQYSFQFLSRYIWVYCGFGPAKNGIIREIDEALKPGVYALIDSCSADDLQLLHTSFGEGPCRSTLASLQHDYKLNFQFGGKV